MLIKKENNKRILFVTDLHGQYTKFANLLEKHKYNEEEDILILGGDYFDRGNENDKVAAWLIENYKKDNVYLIRGNHDDFMIDLFKGNHLFYEFNYKNNGLNKTIQNLIKPNRFYDPARAANVIRQRYPELPEVMNNLVNYVKYDKLVFTHGSVPLNYEENTNKRDWELARWGNSMEFSSTNNFEETFIIGHFSVQHLGLLANEGTHYVKNRNVIFADSGLTYYNNPGFLVEIKL